MFAGLPDDVAQLLEEQQYERAAETLLQQASQGDAQALYTLAMWRISGRIVRRDKEIARQILERCAANGHAEAQKCLVCFRAAGTGSAPDWGGALDLVEKLSARDAEAREQLDLVRAMNMDGDGIPTGLAGLEPLSERPGVWTVRAFLSRPECEYVARKAAPRLAPTTITDRASGRTMPHPVRRSDGAMFGVTDEDIVINAINRRIAAVSGTETNQAEPLQVLHYRPGGEFRPHVDTVAEGGNQRILTALLYLTQDYEGGETEFIKTGLRFKGAQGDLLLFRNVTHDGRPDSLAEHAGRSVTKGTKTIASRWIWRDPPQFSPPAPLIPGS